MIPVSSAHLSDPVPVRQPAERSSTTAGVGIVLVSHSRALAEDALDLARRLIAAVDVPFNKYLNNTQSGHWIVNAYSHFDLNIDDANLKMSEVIGDAAKFEMILTNNEGQQYMYINGSYNVKTNKVRNVVATYLKDGAVARDNVAKTAENLQNTEIPYQGH